MTRAKWLSIAVCVCLILSPQTWVNATPTSQEGEPPAGLDRMRLMITGDSVQFFVPGNPSGDEPAITNQQTDITYPSWAKAVFQTYRNNQWDIYLLDPITANEVHLTSDATSEVYPSLAKGGSQVAFASNRSGNYDIYVVNADGSGLTALAVSSFTDTYPVWSPDASQIVFQSNRSGDYELYVMNADGSNLTQVTHSSAYDGEASWSPDGSQMAFVSSRSGMYEIWVMNADGSNPHQLTSYSTTATPAWSPRGDKIVYANDINMDEYYDLAWIDPDGSHSATLVSESQYDKWAPSWSPDGKFFSYIRTNYSYGNQYGWTSSSSMKMDPYDPYATFPHMPYDDKTMRFNWASTDLTPPIACTIQIAKDQLADTFPLNWTALDSESGLAFYDIQARSLSGGAWVDFLTATNQTGGIFTRNNGDQFEFRCRARDLTGNLGDWTAAPYAATTIHSYRATSNVAVSQRYVKGSQVQVRWAGKDPTTTSLKYDIFFRDGDQGIWAPWWLGVTMTTAVFNGLPGHTYYFRGQAHDAFGHSQVWQPDAQAAVTFYSASLSVRAYDPRGNPLGIPTVALTPPAVNEETNQDFRAKRLGVNPGAVKISAAQTGFGPLSDTTLDISGDRDFALIMPPADNISANGGFESGGLAGWGLSGDGVTVSNAEFHTGQHAVKITPGTSGTSEIRKTMSLSAALHQPTLSFLYYFPDNPDGAALSVEAISSTIQSVVLSTTAVTSGWTHVWADLSAFSGQTVTLRIRLTGSTGAVYMDEVSLGSWNNPALQSLDPAQWQANQPQQITITGQNFSAVPQLFLNHIPLKNVTLLDAGHISAQTPSGMPGGFYTLRLIDASGLETALPDPVLLLPLPVFVPLVKGTGVAPAVAVPEPVPPSDWLTVGKDEHHSGYVADDPGASRYGQVWSLYPKGYVLYKVKIDQVVSADGVLVVTQQYYSGGIIDAFDVSTGSLLWSHEYVGFGPYGPASIANGMVCFIFAGTHCFNLYTGQIVWESGAYTEGNNILIIDQNIYVSGISPNNMNSLTIHNAANGSQKNYFDLEKNPAIWTPAFADGKIYTWANGIFSEHDPVNGKVLWNLAQAWNAAGTYSMPVISNRTALVVSTTALHAIDLDLHRARWTVPGSYSLNLPAAAGDVVYAINGSVLEARQLSNGALLGSFTAPAALLNSPVLSGSHVLVSTADTTYLLDRATLHVQWTAPEGGWLTLANGYLFIARSDGNVSAYRAQER